MTQPGDDASSPFQYRKSRLGATTATSYAIVAWPLTFFAHRLVAHLHQPGNEHLSHHCSIQLLPTSSVTLWPRNTSSQPNAATKCTPSLTLPLIHPWCVRIVFRLKCVKSTLSRRPQILSPCICNASQASTLTSAGQWSPVELFSFDFWTIFLTRSGRQSPLSNSLVASISSLAGGRPKLFPKVPHLSRSSARALRESTKWTVQAAQTTTPARSVTGSGLPATTAGSCGSFISWS
jgi:hypothetical protein